MKRKDGQPVRYPESSSLAGMTDPAKQRAGRCRACGTQLLQPVRDRLCGFCREERAA